jgi:hypothetical protein
MTELEHALWRCEVLACDTQRSKAKILESGKKALCVIVTRVHPDIEILRVPWIPMRGNGISADDQVADIMRVQQRDEFFEILSQHRTSK